MSFGFSVGDFIGALQLVGQVIQCLKDAGGSSAEYQELIRELDGLEKALAQIKQLELENGDQHPQGEVVALRFVASQCQRSIDDFCIGVAKYQKHLRRGRTGRGIAAAIRKIQWRLCTRESLDNFRTEVAAHAQSLQILLLALQARRLQHAQNQSLSYATSIQNGISQLGEKITSLANTVSQGVVQSAWLMERAKDVIRMNMVMFQLIGMIHKAVTALPPPVERQQPVHLIDALGRVAPFHLEFIRSSEALKAVLVSNFRNVPSGLRKIECGDFVLQDSATKRQINLDKKWDVCFLPGQRVTMSMVFRWQSPSSQCPNCTADLDEHEGDNECPDCGLVFERVVEAADPQRLKAQSGDLEPQKMAVKQHVTLTQQFNQSFGLPSSTAIMPRPPQTAYDEEEDIHNYRRVKVVRRVVAPRVWQTRDVSDTMENGGLHAVDDDADMERDNGPDIARNDVHDDDEEWARRIAAGLAYMEPHRDVMDLGTWEMLLGYDDCDEEDEFGRAFSQLVVEGTLDDGQAWLAELEAYIRDFSFSQASSLAHLLKGSCYTIGLSSLGGQCYEMQTMVRDEEANETDLELQERYFKQLKIIQNGYQEAFKLLKEFYRIKV